MSFPEFQTAVMDWGIGGLSVYREIKRLDPGRSILYFSDAGAVAYGKMSPQELDLRVNEVCDYFLQHGIGEVVIACNAASTVVPRLKVKHRSSGLRITDVISCAIRMVENTPFHQIGVIGGRRTILSRIYQRALSSASRKIAGRIAQPLSGMIERGELDSPTMRECLRTTLAPLQSVDALLLACTHYPAVAHLIQPLVPKGIILDPATATAEELMKVGSQRPNAGVHDVFLTTGDPDRSTQGARLAFDVRVQFQKLAF